MKRSIGKIDLTIYALYIAVFKIYLIPERIQQAMKIVLLAGVAFYLINHCERRQLLNKAVPLCISIVLSGVLSHRAGIVPLKSVFDALLHAICLYLIFLLTNLRRSRAYYDRLVNCIYRITSVYCAISLISIALRARSGDKSEILYFFGYKFMTSYYFIFWLSLYQMINARRQRGRMRSVIATIFVMMVCAWVDCATAMVALAAVTMVRFLPRGVRRRLRKRRWMMLLVLLAGILPFYLNRILERDSVQVFVQEVLGRRISLTGRVPIYMELKRFFSQRRWFGYGYGNRVIFEEFGYGNAQNGLLEHMMLYGNAGVLVLLGTLWRCMKRSRSMVAEGEGWYMIFYALLIASVVEISFNYIFYLSVFALSGLKAVEGQKESPWVIYIR